MLILITNDDGIDSPGLAMLREIGKALGGEVWTSAPEMNHSGAGHSLSLHEPVRIREVGERQFAVRGTPTDSVIMGVHHVLKGRTPDLILSGINRGSNLAEDVTYSGTIAACLEGAQLGIRSIALSQQIGAESKPAPRYHTALAHAPDLIRKLLAIKWTPGTLFSLNFPDLEPEDVGGVCVTVQGQRDPGLLRVEERHDTWGNPYYWLAYKRSRSEPHEGTDLWAIHNGHISVTPLSLEMSHEQSVNPVRAALGLGAGSLGWFPDNRQ
ncbi:MAG: 5'/3'-nucleotidase SurE [Hyphomicrobiaceae bacterium]